MSWRNNQCILKRSHLCFIWSKHTGQRWTWTLVRAERWNLSACPSALWMDVNGAESLLWVQVCSRRCLRRVIRRWRDTVGSVPALCRSLNSFLFSFHLFHCSGGDLKVISCPRAHHYLCVPFIITVSPPINTRSCTFVSQVSWQWNKSTCDLTATKLPFVKPWMTLLPIGNEITCRTPIHHKSCHSRHYYTFYTAFFVC